MDKVVVKPTWQLAWGLVWRMILITLGIYAIIFGIMFAVGVFDFIADLVSIFGML